MKPFFLLILLFLSEIAFAQTPYPLSFYWKGEIENQSSFEIRVNLLESDKIINGKGSKLKGICIFNDSCKRFNIEGEIKNNDFIFNCLDSANKIVQSFVFPNADGRNKSQSGKWTDGTSTKAAFIKNTQPEDLPKSYTLGFCVAVNLRFKALSEDSLHKSFFSKMPKMPYQTIGEGYILDKEAYQRASYYGKDYLEFSDTIHNEKIKEINCYRWQLLQSKSRIPFVMEIYSKFKENKLKILTIKVLSFKGAKWVESDYNIFPDSSLMNWNVNKVEIKVQDFFNCADKMIFYLENNKPLIWLWKEEKFILE
jgi:hypothetical protein